MMTTGMSSVGPRIQRCMQFVSVALLVAAISCSSKPKTEAPGGFAHGKSVFAAGNRALSMLPADTLVAVVGQSPTALAQKLRWPDFMREYGPAYDEMRAEIVNELGVDLMEAEDLASIGVDPGAGFGLAVLKAVEPNVVLFATVTDADKLRSFFSQWLLKHNEKAVSRFVGNAEILTPADAEEVGMVIRGGQGFLAIVDHKRDRDAIVNAIAVVAPEASLSATSEFQETAAKLDFGSDIAAYFALHEVGRLLEAELHRDSYSDYLEGEIASTEREIAAAKERGEDTALLQERLVSARETLERSRRRNRAGHDMVREVFAGLGGIAMGAELAGPALKIKTRIRPEPGSIPAAVLRPAKEPLAFWRAGKRPPLFAITGHTDPGALFRLVELFAAVEGEDMDRIDAKLLDKTGISLMRDVRPLLDGELALAFDAPEGTGLADWDEDNFGFQLIAGVTDKAKAQALLTKVASQSDLAKMLKKRPDGGLEMPFPLSGTLYIDMVGNYVVAATDRDLKSRLLAGNDGFAGKLPDGQKALVRDNVSAAMLLDQTVFAWMLFGTARYTYSGEMVPDNPQETEEYRQAVAELRQLDEELEAAQKKLEAAELQSLATAMRTIGRMMLTAEVRGDAIYVYGGQYMGAKDLAAGVQAFMDAFSPELARMRAESTGAPASDVPALKKRVNELYDRRWQLMDRLNGTRQQAPAPAPEIEP